MPASTKTDNAVLLLSTVGERGLTWRDLAAATSGHHGSASAMLTKLHQRGSAARLAEKRDGSSIYVSPENVAGREVVGGRPRVERTAKVVDIDIDVLIDAALAVADLQRVAESAELEAQLQIALMELADFRREAQLDRAADREHFEVELGKMRVKDETARKRYSARVAEATNKAEREMAAQVAQATARGREEGEASGWQDGYDEGIKRGQELSPGGSGDSFTKGRALGRAEGEELVGKRVQAVSAEMFKVITENSPIRAHFKGCYKVHPECAVKALSRAAGLPGRPAVPLSVAG